MIEVPGPPQSLIVVGDFPMFSPDELFLHWVSPELLTQWWPQLAEVDGRSEGRYRFEWPDMKWRLEGSYTEFHLGRHLGFTWLWQHEQELEEPKQVDVYFMPVGEGTRMAIHHGPFDPSSVDRQSVMEGWMHFGMRLAGLRRTDPDPVP